MPFSSELPERAPLSLLRTTLLLNIPLQREHPPVYTVHIAICENLCPKCPNRSHPTNLRTPIIPSIPTISIAHIQPTDGNLCPKCPNRFTQPTCKNIYLKYPNRLPRSNGKTTCHTCHNRLTRPNRKIVYPKYLKYPNRSHLPATSTMLQKSVSAPYT